MLHHIQNGLLFETMGALAARDRVLHRQQRQRALDVDAHARGFDVGARIIVLDGIRGYRTTTALVSAFAVAFARGLCGGGVLVGQVGRVLVFVLAREPGVRVRDGWGGGVAARVLREVQGFFEAGVVVVRCVARSVG